jgi:hypothetical protein
MKLIRIIRSPNPDKKWEAQFLLDNGKIRKTSFGAAGSLDETIGAGSEKARQYRARHAVDLRTGDPTRAGYLAYYILWSGPNMTQNITAYKKRFNL